MTTTEVAALAETPKPFIGPTTWLLRRFTAGGLVTDVASDQHVALRFEPAGRVTVEAGLLSGSGQHDMIDSALQCRGLSVIDPTGCLGDDSLERRVVAALRATFTVDRSGNRLSLRSGDVALEFTAIQAGV